MRSKLLVAAGLALAMLFPLVARAAPTLYEYTFWHVTNPYFELVPNQPEFTDFHGVFAGEDLDADGVIEQPEVTLFYVGLSNSYRLVPVNTGWAGPQCIPDPPGSCDTFSSLDLFSYDLQTGAFQAKGGLSGFEGYSLETGVGVFYRGCGTCLSPSYWWTAQTTVSVRPVPEPATAALWAIGLALLLLFRRRAGAGS